MITRFGKGLLTGTSSSAYGTFNQSPIDNHGVSSSDISVDLAEKLSSGQRGAVITPWLNENFPQTGEFATLNTQLEPEELRANLIFFDRFDNPVSSIFNYNFPEFRSLEELGIGQRSVVRAAGTVAEIVRRVHVNGFFALDEREPGMWALAGNAQTVGLLDNDLTGRQAFTMRLSNALPVFHRSVPFEDILEFKGRRQAEIMALRHHMSEAASEIGEQGVNGFEATVRFERFDAALADHARAMRESNWKKVLTSLSADFKWTDLAGGIAGAISGHLAHYSLGSTLLAATGAVAASLSVSSAVGPKRTKDKSPFRYLTHIERELF